MPADPAAPRGAAPRRARAGFRQAAALVSDRIRTAGESRGFAVTRLLTHWAEIAGPDIAAQARPVKIGYRRDGLGATLTLLTTGAAAPLVQMQVPQIRERVNACYGYNAIARITLTQTAPTGFAEGQADFTPAPGARAAAPAPATPETRARAADIAAGVQDAGLRSALESLAQNVLARGTRSGSTNRKDDPHG
jgi:hypothetical protein